MIESLQGVPVKKKAKKSAAKRHSFPFLCDLWWRFASFVRTVSPLSEESAFLGPLKHVQRHTGDNEGPTPFFESCEPLAEKDVRATLTRRIYYYCRFRCLFLCSQEPPALLRKKSKLKCPLQPFRCWFGKTKHRVGDCDSSEGLSR